MEKHIARSIIKSFDLIPGKISKQVLWAIQKNLPLDPMNLPKGISHEQIEELRKSYKEAAVDIEGPDQNTRNHVFYTLIQKKIPLFSWKFCPKNKEQKSILLNIPRIKNLEPSLLSLLLHQGPFENKSSLQQRYPMLAGFKTDLIDAIEQLFQKLQVIYPDETNMQGLINWLQRGLAGEVLTLFSLACPDYSVEATGDPQCPYRHTFNELGSGIGPIARRILSALPAIDETFKQFGITIRPILSMADYEVLTEANLTRVNLTAEVFLQRMQSSRNAFQESCSIPIQTPMITELSNGHHSWLALLNQFKARFHQNDFGLSQLNRKKLLAIIKTRKQLYDRWQGVRPTLDDYLPQLLEQGAEYAAVGSIINRNFRNCLILGADHSAFAPFYSTEQFLPSLYLRRFYC